MDDIIELPTHYLDRFEKHPYWIQFFEKHDMPHFISASIVATYLNAQMIYTLLGFEELKNLVHILDDHLQARLYVSSLFLQEKFAFPYQEIFGDGCHKDQFYKAWRLFFSSYLKQQGRCDSTLIHFVMTTIDHVFSWEPYQINIALTLFYEWLIRAKVLSLSPILHAVGHHFDDFLYHIGYALFRTLEPLVVIRELCKRFHLPFNSAHSFLELTHQFSLWGGYHTIYSDTAHRLETQLILDAFGWCG